MGTLTDHQTAAVTSLKNSVYFYCSSGGTHTKTWFSILDIIHDIISMIMHNLANMHFMLKEYDNSQMSCVHLRVGKNVEALELLEQLTSQGITRVHPTIADAPSRNKHIIQPALIMNGRANLDIVVR